MYPKWRFRGMREGSTQYLMLDLLETYFGTWLAKRHLFDLMERRFGGRSSAAVDKAFVRLVARADELDIDVRTVPTPENNEIELRVSMRSFPESEAA